MNRSILPGLVALAIVAPVGCGEDLPTTLDPDLIPVSAVTVEIRLPWDQFAQDLQVHGGFGAASDLNGTIIAQQYQGSLDARALVRFEPLPSIVFVRDSTGTVRPDSSLSFKGGRLVARFDTLREPAESPIAVGANTLLHRWHEATADWTTAVDTLGVTELWPEAGGGPVESIGSEEWDPAEADSVVIEVDSATAVALTDTLGTSFGLRLDAETQGARARIAETTLLLDAVPSSHPDTLVTVELFPIATTFIYQPTPVVPGGDIRIGGAPSFRTVMRLEVPEVLDGPPSLCARVECPFRLEPERINAATLVLRSRQSAAGFQPLDSLRLDVRPVLAPERLPKAPLGSSVVDAGGIPIAPEAFGVNAGAEVSIPLTEFVRASLSEEDDGAEQTVPTLALLSVFEPLPIWYGGFAGPGEEGEPFLRLLVTTADTPGIR